MNAKASASALASDLQSDVKSAIAGAEDMLAHAASSTGDKAAEMRARALDQLKALQSRLKDAQGAAVKKGKAAAHATDEYAHENPWRITAAAVCLGLIVGLLVARR